MPRQKKKLGQEPAFPRTEADLFGGGFCEGQTGMSKRFYAACAAMQGVLSDETAMLQLIKFARERGRNEGRKFIIEAAYALADELLRQELL